MRDLSTESRWRGRLIYVAMSLLVAWHTFVMVAAVAPPSAITQAAAGLISPYVILFNLDNYWGFFAPKVGAGYQFRYVVEDAAGQTHMFIPANRLSRFSPYSIWLRDHYRAIMDSVDTYGEATVAELCHQHAALNPVAVSLLEVVAIEGEGKQFGPQDHRRGKKPLDPEFVTVNQLKTIRCPKP